MTFLKRFFLPCFIAFVAGIFPLRVSFAVDCVVTDGGGDSDPGTLLYFLTHSEEACTRITFGDQVNALQPLLAIADVTGGITIEGKAGIVIRPAGNIANPSCALRIAALPPHRSTEPATLKNLTVENERGNGICVIDQEVNGSAARPNNNIFENIIVHASNRGIDLGNSDFNTITDATVVGFGNAAEIGIYINGEFNRITPGSRGIGRIENFTKGVYINNRDSFSYVGKMNYINMRENPIFFPNAPRLRSPDDIRYAFANDHQFTMSARAPAAVSGLEVYRATRNGLLTSYEYMLTLSKQIPLHPRANNLSSFHNERRYIRVVKEDETDLRIEDDVALLSVCDLLIFCRDVGMFSNIYTRGEEDVVEGNVNCAENRWFWQSFDMVRPWDSHMGMCDDRDDGCPDRGWNIDFDRDGLANGRCTRGRCGHPAIESEDQDFDCNVDYNESDPDDWTSQYDFDCDGVADHRVGFRASDNCVLKMINGAPVNSRSSTALHVACVSPVPAVTEEDCFRNSAAHPYCTTYKSYNPLQLDNDGDTLGNACEEDLDDDTINDGTDNCPTVSNPDQRDSDGNGTGDACEQVGPAGPPIPPGAIVTPDDADGDGISNLQDNCPFDYNPGQENLDGDLTGDACDSDDDNDGLADTDEGDKRDANLAPNPDGIISLAQYETDPRDADSDNDGICDGPNRGLGCTDRQDNCPYTFNPEQQDLDEDGIGDACDVLPREYKGDYANLDDDPFLEPVDSDHDGVTDDVDNCPSHYNPDQKDFEGYYLDPISGNLIGDGVGDMCDSDDDNDGLDDATESGILDWRRRTDATHLSYLDKDVDRDSVVDGIDLCIHYKNNVGATDENEDYWNERGADIDFFPTLLQSNYCGGQDPNDIDGDGIENGSDAISASKDNCPFVPNPNQLDTDQDGKGDACDLDDDNDDNTNPDIDRECFLYLQGNGPQGFRALKTEVVARNGSTCLAILRDPAVPPATKSNLLSQGGCRRTCDVDESGNLRLHAWNPDSDRELGILRRFSDNYCDGAGVGFGPKGSRTRCEAADSCPEFYNAPGTQGLACGVSFDIVAPDFDSDTIPDDVDNCPNVSNTSQFDTDKDNIGDACDNDKDGDGIFNVSDNCPADVNFDQTDTDKDGLGDVCDPNPFTPNLAEVQGGGGSGCQISAKAPFNIASLFIVLASIGLIAIRRRQTFLR